MLNKVSLSPLSSAIPPASASFSSTSATILPADLSVTLSSSSSCIGDIVPKTSKSINHSPMESKLFYGSSNRPSIEMYQQMQQRTLQHTFKPTVSSLSSISSMSSSPSIPTSICCVNKMDVDNDSLTNLEDAMPKTHNTDSIDQNESIDDIEVVIRTYFTDVCSKQPAAGFYNDVNNDYGVCVQSEPLNLKNERRRKLEAARQSTSKECVSQLTELHLHCLINGCGAAVAKTLTDISEHMHMHELTRRGDAVLHNSSLMQITSIDGFFNRKRGRPPKNRVVEVYNNVSKRLLHLQLKNLHTFPFSQ